MTYSVHEHIALKRVSAITASPDSSWLAVAVQRLDRDGVKYVSDLWKVPTDGAPQTQLTRGDTQDIAPCFRHDGALGFLSNRLPNELKPDEDAEKRMQVWVLPAGGGEPQQVTDEPLGVEAFQFARNALRLVLLAPVLLHIAHDKQRETAAEHAKKGASVRRYTQQPVRHWDHWLHENVDLPYTHLIAYAADGTHRVDLTPAAQREFAIEPQFDVSSDGTLVAVTRHTPGADRELDTTILLIDIASAQQTVFGAGTNVNHEPVCFSPDGTRLATVRSFRSPQAVMRPTLTLIDIANNTERELAREWDRWPHLEAWSNDGKRLIVTADDAGSTP
ncbi:MAG: TolB family protein, partial [Longimicrobiales bacterium]